MQNVFKAFTFTVLSACIITPMAKAERYRGAVASSGSASSSSRSSSLKTTVRSSPAQSNAFGGIELRPGVETVEGAVSTENGAWLGMAFPSWKLSYNQDFDTAASSAENSHEPIVGDGHVKLKFDDLWTDGKTGFSEEFRAYVPTNADKRNKGMVTAFRNYFKISTKLSPTTTLRFALVPILHMYSDAGSLTATGAEANPSFENRIIFGFDFALSTNVTLSVPLHFYTTKYRDFAEGAKLNNEWDPNFFFWPEIDWNINGGPFMIGAAYRSNNLTKVSEEGTTSDFNGTFQAVLGVSF